MSNNFRPQGSEKIQDPDQKLARIREIAGITQKPAMNEQHRLNTKSTTVLHEATAADGNTYGLIQEGAKVYLKRLVNDHYEYLTGDEKDYAYKNFAEGFKHMNLLFKDISQQNDFANSINLFEGGLSEKKNLTEKFVLKTPSAQPPVSQDVPTPTPPSADVPPSGDAMPPTDPQASQQLGQEMGDIQGQADSQDPVKAIQKMIGKATQQMRQMDKTLMTSEFMKATLNSVISAMDVQQLEDADLLSIVKKLKGEENPEMAGQEPNPEGTQEFQDEEGNDYNVNQPEGGALPPVQEEITQPTFDDGVMPNILSRVVANLGTEINDANENELKQAVQLFVNTYSSDQNQTGFMKQLQDYVNNDAPLTEVPADYNLRYTTLTPMGQEVFDQLELLDPNMGDLTQDPTRKPQFQTATSASPSMAAETTEYLRKTIMEVLNKRK